MRLGLERERKKEEKKRKRKKEREGGEREREIYKCAEDMVSGGRSVPDVCTRTRTVKKGFVGHGIESGACRTQEGQTDASAVCV